MSASQTTDETGYINPVHDLAAQAIAGVLSRSGLMPPGPALNCAMACLVSMKNSGLAVIEGKMELWQQ